jgi:hypothetical protein
MYTAREAVLPLWALPNSVDANVETFKRRDAASFSVYLPGSRTLPYANRHPDSRRNLY